MNTRSAKSGKTDNPNKPASENVILALETIFASDPVPDSVISWRSRQQILNPIIKFVGDQFTKVLATTETRSASRIVRSVATSLRHFDLTIEDAMTVVDRVCDRIRTEGAMLEDAHTTADESTDNAISNSETKYSEGAGLALNGLGFECVKYIIEKTKKEIEPLSLPDKVIEVQRRKMKGSMYEPYYEQAHNVILRDLAAEIDLQQQRKKIQDAIQVNGPEVTRDPNEGKDEYNPTERGLTRQLAMMLLDELFPNLKDVKPTPKGNFLQLLTGFNAKGLANRWGDYNLGSKDYEADLQTVAEWKKKLKIKD